MKAQATFEATPTLSCAGEKKGRLRVISRHSREDSGHSGSQLSPENWLFPRPTRGKTRSVHPAGSTVAAKDG